MNWFMWVWLGGAALYLLAGGLLVLATIGSGNYKLRKPDNIAGFIATIISGFIVAAIPFVSLLIGVVTFLTFPTVLKATQKKVEEGFNPLFFSSRL